TLGRHAGGDRGVVRGGRAVVVELDRAGAQHLLLVVEDFDVPGEQLCGLGGRFRGRIRRIGGWRVGGRRIRGRRIRGRWVGRRRRRGAVGARELDRERVLGA